MSLIDLEIKNLAVAKDIRVNLSDGFNILTGETGAGKSVILKGLELVLGARTDIDLIRSGCNELTVQAEFDLAASGYKLDELPEFIDDFQVVISREINAKGKNKIYLNGRLATLKILQECAPYLLSICSQGQNVQLLKKDYHREILDAYALNDLLLAEYQDAYNKLQKLNEAYEQSQQEWDYAREHQEYLERDIQELESVDLENNSRELLASQIKTIKGRQADLESYNSLKQIINEPGAIADLLHKAGSIVKDLSSQEDRDKIIQSLNLMAEEANQIEKLADASLGYVDDEEVDLAALEDALADIARLQRKYRTDDQGLKKLLEEKVIKLGKLESVPEPAVVKQQQEKQSRAVALLADKLSQKRHDAAEKLSEELVKILAELNLPKSRFNISFQKIEPGRYGQEKVEFLISTNPGQDLHDLAKVASGGELSRILLAFKCILNKAMRGGCCFVFDEIDTGISGATAHVVGEKLREVSRAAQVVCITHLPQIAALADEHFLIEKIQGEETVSTVKSLGQEERKLELARLLSGKEITDTAMAAADEMMRV